MKQRSVIAVVLLTIFTLGIYSLFWLYHTRQELVSYGRKIPSMWMLFAPALTIFGLVLIAIVGGRLEDQDAFASPIGGVFLLLVIPLYFWAGFYPLYWFYQYCKAAASVTNDRVQLGAGYALYVLSWLFGFTLPIWVGLMQDAFNKTPMPIAANNAGPMAQVGPTWSSPITNA